MDLSEKVPRGGEAVERPILFRVSDPAGRHLGLATSLTGAVAIAARSRRKHLARASYAIHAVYADGSEEAVAPERYVRRKEVTAEDAIHYIRRRDEGLRLAKEMGVDELLVEALLGDQKDLCNPEDPEEKQIEDYIKNKAEGWRPDEELNAEEKDIYRATNRHERNDVPVPSKSAETNGRRLG